MKETDWKNILSVMKWRIGILLLFILLYGCESGQNEAALYINDEPVSVTEMEYWMSLHKSEVYSHFYRQYKVDFTPAFWLQDFDGQTPLKMLKNIALERLIESKVQQLLARDLGVIELISFDEIIAETGIVNQSRKESVARGEPVYGPVEFHARTYFAHVFDKMVYDVKQVLLRDLLSGNTGNYSSVLKESDIITEKTGFQLMQVIDKVYESLVYQLIADAELKINNKVFDRISVD